MTRPQRKLRFDDVDQSTEEANRRAPRPSERKNGATVVLDRYRPFTPQDELEDLWDNVPV